MKRDHIAKYLQRSVLFRQMNMPDLESFADFCRVVIVPEGDYVYRQGEESSTFYIIAEGEVELVLDREGGDRRAVGRISKGGHFGETGLLTGKQRSVNVKALFDLVLICFEKRVFRSALLGNPIIHKELDASLAERLREAFQDQADTDHSSDPYLKSSADDVILFRDRNYSQIKLKRLERKKQAVVYESKTAQQAQTVINAFAANKEPYILSGEAGTGKQIIARQIHAESSRAEGPYVEIDLREHDPAVLDKVLFGKEQFSHPFAKAREAGIFEKSCGGTLAFFHVRLMPVDVQRKIVRAIESRTYQHVDSETPIALHSRIIFISVFELDYLESTGKIIPELMVLFRKQYFNVPPLREHKRDLPRLIEHYLQKFNKEYAKNIKSVPSEIIAGLMNYDWPGNLAELSSVMRRAVMLAHRDEILPDHILLGLPKTEGKWEFNILRIPFIKRFFESKFYPTIPQSFVGLIIAATIIALFLGSSEPDMNIGLILSWSIGWPIMFFSFFFFARTWCSVCTLAMPGKHLQNLVKPTRATPAFIKEHSGWLMAILCILVMWVEIVWNAYENPHLTGWIILAVSIGSCVCSVLYARRAWCRYLCPLGAINAIFAMPSVLELRSNRHVCLNRCHEHNCFGGGEVQGGCPMFRHPYLVDNNRDCIICGDCIKNCNNSSIHLNVRLAPQELWSLETPRRADSFLIVALGAIFFTFALHGEFHDLSALVAGSTVRWGFELPVWLAGSMIFFTLIMVFQVGYHLMVKAQAWRAKMDSKFLMSMLGYGFIPLILGGYLAVHLEMFVSGAGHIVPAVQQALQLPVNDEVERLLSHDSTYMLQIFSVVGGLIASMYATYRIINRLLTDGEVSKRELIIPFSFLITMGGLFLFMV